MIHVTSGDAAADRLVEAGIATDDEIVPVREALILGPRPATEDIEEWARARAAHLAVAYGADHDETLAALLGTAVEITDAMIDGDPIHLWFGSDLFCQLNLLWVLSLIGYDTTSRIELHDDSAASLAGGVVLGEPQLDAAHACWDALLEETPAELQAWVDEPGSPHPGLVDAMGLHLQRLPWRLGGEGRLQRIVESAVEARRGDGIAQFVYFQEHDPGYGIGDLQFELIVAHGDPQKQPGWLWSSRDGHVVETGSV